MNKSSKTFAAFTMAALLTGGSLFAQSQTSDSKKDDSDKPNAEFGRMEPRRNMMPNMMANMAPTDQNVIIGQVKKVDTKSSEITITNTDGKDVALKVTPFTNVNIVPATRPNPGEMKNMMGMKNKNGMKGMPANETKDSKVANANESETDDSKIASADERKQMRDMPPMRNGNQNPDSIKDIRNGSWILAATYKTDTKKPTAAQLVVKQDRIEPSATIDAK